MHGRPRTRPALDPRRRELEEAKTASFQALLQQVLQNHRDRNFSKEALAQNAKLLEANPEVYTAWNYRKLAVTHLLDSQQDEVARKAVLDNELLVIERALMCNFKSYGAWHHRKWILQFGLSSLEHEYRLLNKLLTSDARNFHGWAYRRFLANIKKMTDEDELQFTIQKINENFSNYSAWHNRSVLWSKQFLDSAVKRETWLQVLTEEYDLVKQAFFTEPDDQSGWFYLMWLLSQTVIPFCPVLEEFWPPNGSSIVLNLVAPFRTKNLIVLWFSLPVWGVNTETVSVKLLDGSQLPVAWSSIPATSCCSKVWISDLGASCKCLESRGSQIVEVEVEISPGIVSKYGPLVGAQQFHFSLEVGSSDVAILGKHDGLAECVVWPGECDQMFHRCESSKETVLEGPTWHCMEPREQLSDWQKDTLTAQIDTCRELLDLEQDSKWAMLILARVLEICNHHTRSSKACSDEVQNLYKSLMNVDPTHANYYDEQLSLLHFNEITSNVHTLSKYSWVAHHSNGNQELWLRFDNLSLSKLGYFERLVGVQKLDLSNNKLHCLDGIEVLQYLTDLDLSHNHLPSISSLWPISHLRNLRALNVKWNEIGLHPIDTSRYSLSTALNNSPGSMKCKDFESQSNPIYWEVLEVFGSMGLKQLDIHGNPISAVGLFRNQLVQALPSLIWLDGILISNLLEEQSFFDK